MTMLKRMPKQKQDIGMEIFEDNYDPEVFMPMEGSLKIQDREASQALVHKITKALNERKVGVLVYHLTDDEFEFIGVARRDANASKGMKFPL